MQTSLSNRISRFLIVLISIINLSSVSVLASPAENIIAGQEIADQIMSPYCPGRTLSACPSDDARKLRQQIIHQLDQGYSKEAVKRQMVGIYGKDILGAPVYRGFGIVAWLAPVMILFISLMTLILYIKKDKSALFRLGKQITNDQNLNVLESELYLKSKI